jgi:xanthine dehydrogenase accessory factor
MGNNKLKILVRGAGDIASGIIWNLAYAGFNVCCTEVEDPSTIRTEVAFSTAIYEGKKELSGVECVLCDKDGLQSSPVRDVAHKVPGDGVASNANVATAVYKCWEEKKVALIIDPNAKILDEIKFDVVVDAILAKKNLGTKIDMASLVIGVGPGFTTNVDCHIAIETMRGHNLARIIENGSPIENTGVPGVIAGHSSDRVIHSPASGVIHNLHKIGDEVKKDEVIAVIDEGPHSSCVCDVAHIVPGDDGAYSSCLPEVRTPIQDSVKVLASIDGILRGIIRDGYNVTEGLKIADIDPRLSEKDNCFTISDKARSIGGAVVVAILRYLGN